MTVTPAPTGLVVAVEDGGPNGARVTVETDERAPAVHAADPRPRYKTETHWMDAGAYRALLRERAGGAVDGLLARMVELPWLRPSPLAPLLRSSLERTKKK